VKYIIANWKLNGRQAFIDSWCSGFTWQATEITATRVTVVIAPPAPYFTLMRSLQTKGVCLSAQNISVQASDGAHTGEISASMVKDLGCQYVIVGHSERRQLGETDEYLQKKIANAAAAGLIPIFCVGEPLAFRQENKAWSFVEKQLAVLNDYPVNKPLIVAYEPIWAIGTGMTATLEDVAAMHEQIAQQTARPVLYGGSVNATNAQSLLVLPHVAGALVGGASLKPEEFLSIVEAVS